MYKLITILSLAFFAFILWIIFLANTGRQSIFFDFVAIIPFGDKLGHFVLFGVLTLGANFACRLKCIGLFGAKIYIGAISVFSFALLEELSQYFVSERTLDKYDLTADLMGVIAFSLLTYFIAKRFQKKQT